MMINKIEEASRKDIEICHYDIPFFYQKIKERGENVVTTTKHQMKFRLKIIHDGRHLNVILNET